MPVKTRQREVGRLIANLSSPIRHPGPVELLGCGCDAAEVERSRFGTSEIEFALQKHVGTHRVYCL